MAKNEDENLMVQKESISKKQMEKRNERMKSLEFEERMLKAFFGVGLLASLLFLLGYATASWVHVQLPKEVIRVEDTERGVYWKTGHYHGLWRICREELWPAKAISRQDLGLTAETKEALMKVPVPQNMTASTYCRKMHFKLPDTVTPDRVDVETKMMDFRRSTVAVGIIAIVLSVIANAFTCYSLDKLRYMFKRLAGCLHLITGASCWVVTEVFRQSVLYEKKNFTEFHDKDSEVSYMWSYYLVWVSCVMYLVPGIALLVLSRKKKGRKARSMKEAAENEPVVLGRI